MSLKSVSTDKKNRGMNFTNQPTSSTGAATEMDSEETEEDDYWSFIEPIGFSSSECGYCRSKSQSSKSYGVWAHLLSPKVYQIMVDLGWRRSGCYIYLPDRSKTCCTPYTIRCPASRFKPSRSQRQAVNRWKKFVVSEQERLLKNPPIDSLSSSDRVVSNLDVQRDLSKSNKNNEFDLSKIFKSVESIIIDYQSEFNATIDKQNIKPMFEIKIEPATFSKEKFELFKKYQNKVHDEPIEMTTEESFTRFLCTNPFKKSETASLHAIWLLNGRMVAISVLDVLPSGLSSVYLIWDTDLSKLSLGRLSSLREISWINEWKIERGFRQKFDWYYLGYYIHSCPKMRYKGEYEPSFLLDPTTYEWKPLSSCIPILESANKNVTTFTDDTQQLENGKIKKEFKYDDDDDDDDDDENYVKVLTGSRIVCLKKDDSRVREAIKMVDSKILKHVVICL